MRKGRLENWQTIDWCGHTRLAGYVYGMTGDHAGVFPEGGIMITNQLVKYHTVMGLMVAETASGSMYELGVPAKEDRTTEEILKEYMAQIGRDNE